MMILWIGCGLWTVGEALNIIGLVFFNGAHTRVGTNLTGIGFGLLGLGIVTTFCALAGSGRGYASAALGLEIILGCAGLRH
jgi:hypothetical protein